MAIHFNKMITTKRQSSTTVHEGITMQQYNKNVLQTAW